MSSISIALLGTFSICTPEADPIELEPGRLQELVAYLALHAESPVVRQHLAFQFWPDTAEAQALTNLRNLLYKLNKAWPASKSVLRVTRSMIEWRPGLDINVDCTQFNDLLDAADAADSTSDQAQRAANVADHLRAALAYYQGDLLPHSYVDWVLQARESLRSRFLSARQQLAMIYFDSRQYDEALVQAEALLQHDPLRESTYRLLMEIHAARNDRAAALHVYHACATALEHELDVQPNAATQQIYQRLLNLTATGKQQAVMEQHYIPLVGRGGEWRQLNSLWQQASAGRARCVLIRGEAGIGKTRLAEELLDFVTRQGSKAASTRSYAAAGAPAYAPLTEWLRQPAFSHALETVPDLWRVELARLRPDLLAARPDLPPPGPLRETWQQQRFYEAIAQLILVTPQPLLLHIDDLQWCDGETLAALGFLLQRLQSSSLLLVGGVRGEEIDGEHPLLTLLTHLRLTDQLTEIDLGPLAAGESAQLASHTAGAELPVAELDRLYQATEGHPLFLIETVRVGAVNTNGTNHSPQPGAQSANQNGSPDGSSIPAKIKAVIGARLDQLSPAALALAQLAAVIGRNFAFSVLQAAASDDEETLVMALDELWQRRLVREQGADAYDFSHDRIREVAYAGISHARRRLLHRRVAEGMETIYAPDLEAVAGQLAVHYAEAGKRHQATRYFQLAGDLAMKQNALHEAEQLYRRALDGADQDDLRTRLHLLLMLDKALAYHGSQQARTQNLGRIEEAAERLSSEEADLHARVLIQRADYQNANGQYNEALRLAQASTEYAQLHADPALLARAYFIWGQQHWALTQMSAARTLLQTAATYARAANDLETEALALEITAATGMFSGMSAAEMNEIMGKSLILARRQNHRMREASLYNKFGYLAVEQGDGGLDVAEEHYLHALHLGEETGDRVIECNIWSNLIVLYTHMGDYRRAHQAAHEALAIATTTGVHLRIAGALNYRGKALLQQGELSAARRDLEESLRMLQESKNDHFQVKTRSDLGLLYHMMGDQHAAQALLQETLQMVQDYGDTRFEAHAHTRLGYALEAQRQWDAAEQAYSTAEKLHRQMEQFNYSLNAAAGLARVAWQRSEQAAAIMRANTIWEQLDEQTLNATIETIRIYRTCYALLHTNAPDRAAAINGMAQRQLQQRASAIDDEAQQERFWQIPDHLFFGGKTPPMSKLALDLSVRSF